VQSAKLGGMSGARSGSSSASKLRASRRSPSVWPRGSIRQCISEAASSTYALSRVGCTPTTTNSKAKRGGSYRLRDRLSALLPYEYCAEGFTTVVQDNIFGDDVRGWLDSVTTRLRHLVVLRPPTDAVKQRDRDRIRTSSKIAYKPGSSSVEDLDAALDSTPRVGLSLDTTHQTPVQTVEEILARRSETTIADAHGT
jgi:hypothetical protein